MLFFRLGEKSYWGDEAYSAMVVQKPWGEMVADVSRDVHTPLYWVALKAWTRAFGAGERATRSLSALFALGALGLFFGTAGAVGRGPGSERPAIGFPRVAWLSALLLAASPFWILYARMARYYSMTAFLFMLVVWCLVRWMAASSESRGGARPAIARRLWYSAMCLSLLVLAYTNLFAASVYVLVVASLWVARSRHTRAAFLAGVVATAGVSPWLPRWFGATSEHGAFTLTFAPAAFVKGIVLKFGFTALDFSAGEFLPPLPVFIGGAAVLGVCVLGGLFVRRRRGVEARSQGPVEVDLAVALFGAMAAGIVLAAVFLTFPADVGAEFFPARVFFLYPAVLFFAAGTIDVWMDRATAVGVIVFFAVVATFALADFSYYANANPVTSTYTAPWREYAKELVARAGEEDLIVCDEPALLFYVAGRRPVVILNRADQEEAVEDAIRDDLASNVFILWNPKDLSGGAYSSLFDYLSLTYKLEEKEARMQDSPTVAGLKRRVLPGSPEVKREFRRYRLGTLKATLLPGSPPPEEGHPQGPGLGEPPAPPPPVP